jgi:hypothetical protein
MAHLLELQREIATAGSLAAGTGLGRVRFWMQCVEKYSHYELRFLLGVFLSTVHLLHH